MTSDVTSTKVVIDSHTWNALHQKALRQSQHARASAPAAAPIHTDQGQRGTATPMAPEQAEAAARSAAVANNQYSPVDAGTLVEQSQSAAAQPAAPAAIGGQPDPVKSKQCLDKGAANSTFGVVLDRFDYCRRATASFDFYIRYPIIGDVYQGTNRFTFEIYGQGDNTQRHARMFYRVVPDSVHYRWVDPIDDLFTGPDIELSLGIFCVDDNCGSSGGETRPFANWDNLQDWQYSDLGVGNLGATGRDSVGYSRFQLRAGASGEGFDEVSPVTTQPRQLRCDSATYFNQGRARYPEACIFNEVIPYLTYRLGDPAVAGVAQHLDQALNNPDSTYPLTPGRSKHIPGKFIAGNAGVPGLHRILTSDPQYGENGDVKDGACYKKGPYAAVFQTTGLPVPPDTTNPDPTKRQDCDEFPFASTREGAADSYWSQGTHRWDFSVKAVNYSQNRSAGGSLAAYYVNDRMLAYDGAFTEAGNDRFYVNITP